MLSRLELSNYRGFRSLQLELLPVTVIIGANASGKSTLLEAIHVLMAGIDASTKVGGYRPSSLPSTSTFAAIESVVSDVGALLTREGTSLAPELSIAAKFDGGMQGQVQLTARPSEEGVLAVHLRSDCSSPNRNSEPEAPFGPSAVMVRHVSTVPKDEFSRSDDEVERLLFSGLQSAALRNRSLRLGDAALESVNRVLRRLANAELVKPSAISEPEYPSSLAIHYRRDGRTYEIGSGNHALISILSLLVDVETCLSRSSTTGERILLLDEPELHLHPRIQGDLAAHLADRAQACGAQILFVTHSADICNKLVSRTDTAVLALERPFSSPRRLRSPRELLHALTHTHDLMQFSALNFLESRRLLFCEGRNDEAILQRCAEAHFYSAPAQLARFSLWKLIDSEGVGNMPAATLMERLVSSSLLPRLKRSEALVMVAVNDRDYERDPGRRVRKSDQVERIEQVWSRHSIESLFVDERVLSSMLTALLGEAAPSDLQERTRNAINAADRDLDLLESAEDELADVYRHTRQHLNKAAQQEARKVVRAHPETWQRGKDRADVVLRHIRSGLPTGLQNKIRASIPKLLNAIPHDSLRTIVLPEEIKDLLDFLADSA